jgi:hypothetical protein
MLMPFLRNEYISRTVAQSHPVLIFLHPDRGRLLATAYDVDRLE